MSPTTRVHPTASRRRRPGAGPPKGNFNGIRIGNYSDRMLTVYLAMRAYPDPKNLAHELLHAGFIRPRTITFNGDVRGLVQYLYHRWFESPHEPPLSAKCNKQHRRRKPRRSNTKKLQDPPK